MSTATTTGQEEASTAPPPRGGEPAVTEGPTTEPVRILVGVTSAPGSDRLVDFAAALAAKNGQAWFAVTVQRPLVDAVDPSRGGALAVLRRAAALGAEIEVVPSEDEATALIDASRRHGARLLVIGAPGPRRPRDLFRRDLVGRVLRGAGDVDVLLVAPRASTPEHAAAPRPVRRPATALEWLAGPVAIGIAALFAKLLGHAAVTADVAMVFLLAIIVVAFRVPRLPAMATALLAVTCLNFLFVPPTWTLRVEHPRYGLTFVVLALAGWVVSELATRSRARAAAALAAERRTAALYALTRRLTEPSDGGILVDRAAHFLRQHFGREVRVAVGAGAHDEAPGFAWWPLAGSRGALGAIGIAEGDAVLADPDTRHLLEACIAQIAVALDRRLLDDAAREAAVTADTERMRSALLSSVSHDLRTPLAAIQGAATSLLDEQAALTPEARRVLLEDVVDEAQRLSVQVTNLLELTRLGSGLALRGDWHLVDDVLASALARVARVLTHREVRVHDDSDGTLVFLDPLLVELLLVNLLENAARHAPEGPVDVTAAREGDGVLVEVADRGPGLPADEADKVFERFWRAPGAHGGGAGLGLAICEAVARLHGGQVTALHRDGGGARFQLWLPRGGPADLPPPEPLVTGDV